MAEPDLSETAWRRAWLDSEHFRKDSWAWFWVCEILGASAIAAVVGALAAYYTPEIVGRGLKVALPALGTFLGFVVGLLVLFSCIFAFQLVRAPYRQRNELRAEVLTGRATAVRAAPTVTNPKFRVQDGWLLFEATNGGNVADFTVRYAITRAQDVPWYDGVWRDTDKNVTSIDKDGRKAVRLANYVRHRSSPASYEIRLIQLLNDESVGSTAVHYSVGSAAIPEPITLRVELTSNPSLADAFVADCQFRLSGNLTDLDIMSQRCPASV